ncbi:class I adenylate-forming enzyme family protein [Chitinivorax sp. B]|uniref:AMP-binding protein n=1 Tax=Chitinivorax sp. B TaxID=2502235 RepID=UPI002016BC6F|nr:class I adenylate-forming enzyme family protein [Chitinivorax sp. B]
MDVLQDRLIQLGNAVLESTRFGPDATVDNLPEWNALKHVQLLIAIAREFQIPVPLEEAYRLDSFHQLMLLVRHAQMAADEVQHEVDTCTVGAVFLRQVRHQPAAPFLIFPKEGVTDTYQSFYRVVCAAGNQLVRRGLTAGDRLGLVFPNGSEMLAYYLAAQLLGVVVVPINPALTATDMADVIANCDARLTLFDRQLLHGHGKLAELMPNRSLVVVGVASGLGIEVLRDCRDVVMPTLPSGMGSDGTSVIQYTAGATGLPRGVVLSHRNLLSNAKAVADWFSFAANTRALCMLPMFHGNAQVVSLLAPMWVGGSVVVLESKSALPSFWKMIDTYQIHWTSVMPSMLSALLTFRLPRFDRCLRGIISSGQALPDEVRIKFEAEYQTPVYQAYGLAETASIASLNRYPAGLRRAGSIGMPLPGCRMKVVNEFGETLPDGVTGQILIGGDNVASRYHGAPSLSAQRFRDGWFHSGDYGCRDAEGNFYFATRLDDLIVRGGESLYPAELENVLHGCREVVECAAFGVPDPILGQDICIYVKLREGSPFTVADVKHFCQTRMARYKQPQYVVVVNHLADLRIWPGGLVDNLLRRKLREHFMQQQRMGSAARCEPSEARQIASLPISLPG